MFRTSVKQGLDNLISPFEELRSQIRENLTKENSSLFTPISYIDFSDIGQLLQGNNDFLDGNSYDYVGDCAQTSTAWKQLKFRPQNESIFKYEDIDELPDQENEEIQGKITFKNDKKQNQSQNYDKAILKPDNISPNNLTAFLTEETTLFNEQTKNNQDNLFLKDETSESKESTQQLTQDPMELLCISGKQKFADSGKEINNNKETQELQTFFRINNKGKVLFFKKQGNQIVKEDQQRFQNYVKQQNRKRVHKEMSNNANNYQNVNGCKNLGLGSSWMSQLNNDIPKQGVDSEPKNKEVNCNPRMRRNQDFFLSSSSESSYNPELFGSKGSRLKKQENIQISYNQPIAQEDQEFSRILNQPEQQIIQKQSLQNLKIEEEESRPLSPLCHNQRGWMNSDESSVLSNKEKFKKIKKRNDETLTYYQLCKIKVEKMKANDMLLDWDQLKREQGEGEEGKELTALGWDVCPEVALKQVYQGELQARQEEFKANKFKLGKCLTPKMVTVVSRKGQAVIPHIRTVEEARKQWVFQDLPKLCEFSNTPEYRELQRFMDTHFGSCNPREVFNILKINKMNLDAALNYCNKLFDTLKAYFSHQNERVSRHKQLTSTQRQRKYEFSK